jgi:hypothetical protein
MDDSMKAQEVFTPGSFPKHTFVERAELGLADRLRDAIGTPGMLISISGPSKSGKTVFVESTMGLDNLITISGAGVSSATELWDRVLDWMQSPSELAEERQSTKGSSTEVGGGVEGGIPLIGKGSASAKTARATAESDGSRATFKRRGLAQVIEEIAGSDFVLFVDDFHYMQRSAQEEVTKQLKEAVGQKVKIVVASVLHRSDDVVRANPELRGRIVAIDFDYWKSAHLVQIAEQGFGALNARLDPHAASSFARESSGSPQLMQGICLNACFEMGLRERASVPEMITVDADLARTIFERTALTTDFRSLVDALDTGPPTRGTERKVFNFQDGTSGDVYRCILKAIAADPPSLSFTYDELTERVKRICRGATPVGSSVTESCRQMSIISQDKFPRERPLDWDTERGGVLDLPDPYLLFYLRWSGRLLEAER